MPVFFAACGLLAGNPDMTRTRRARGARVGTFFGAGRANPRRAQRARRLYPPVRVIKLIIIHAAVGAYRCCSLGIIACALSIIELDHPSRT